MKILILILCFCSFFCLSLIAQTNAGSVSSSKTMISMNFRFPDSTNREFFRKNVSIQEISVVFRGEKPYAVFLIYEDEHSREHYDLEFEGDAYLLEHKYGTIQYRAPIISAYYKQQNQLRTKPYEQIGAIIRQDSVIYHISTGKHGVEEDIIGGPPQLLEGVGELANTIRELYLKKNLSGEIDSVLVFQGNIGKLPQNQIRNLRLVAGKESYFSKIAYEEIQNKKNAWRPAGISVGPIATEVRIYVRLNKDGSVTIKTPRRLRTLSGV